VPKALLPGVRPENAFAFAAACGVVVLWAASGELFGYSNHHWTKTTLFVRRRISPKDAPATTEPSFKSRISRRMPLSSSTERLRFTTDVETVPAKFSARTAADDACQWPATLHAHGIKPEKQSHNLPGRKYPVTYRRKAPLAGSGRLKGLLDVQRGRDARDVPQARAIVRTQRRPYRAPLLKTCQRATHCL
jgi:hypothetical protein